MFNYSWFIVVGGILATLVLQTLLPVAFYTLLERKLMSALQRRRGPNSVGFWGSLQPVADGLKLLVKEGLIPRGANFSLYLFAPLLSLIVAFSCWAIMPLGYSTYFFDNDFSLLTFLAVSAIGVYGLVLAGWASYSRYALMGALRAVSQLISYEVVLMLTVLPVIVFTGSFSLIEIVQVQEYSCWFIFPCLPMGILFYVIILAETNRTPFDLPEAEAELVSGFNVEYASALFAMFFLAEYSNMILMSTLMVILFFGGWTGGILFFTFKIMVLVCSFIYIRALLPRFRYDQLMFLCWRTFLPLALGFFIFTLGFAFAFEVTPYSVERMFTAYTATSRSWAIQGFSI